MSAPEIKNGKEGEKRKRSRDRPLQRECVSTAAPPLIENAELESAVQVTRMLLVPGLAVKQQGGEKGEEAGGMKGDASAVTLSPEDPRLGKCLISHVPLFFHILGARLGFCEMSSTFVVFWFCILKLYPASQPPGGLA